jgi:hypothetical protein
MVGTVAPALAAPNGGTYDLFTVFVHETDFMLYWSGRSNGTWSTPALINSNAYTSYPVALAPLPNGQFVLVYEGSNEEPYFSLFSPTASTPWTAPALLVGSGPTVSAPPAVAPGVCGYDALAVYVDVGGAEVVGLTGTTWSSPSTIPGTTAATYAAIATSP